MAEYIAAFHTTQLVETISGFFTHTAHHDNKPIPLFIDNTEALKTATAKYPTPKSRYVDVKYHWIREKIDQGLIVGPAGMAVAKRVLESLALSGRVEP